MIQWGTSQDVRMRTRMTASGVNIVDKDMGCMEPGWLNLQRSNHNLQRWTGSDSEPGENRWAQQRAAVMMGEGQ